MKKQYILLSLLTIVFLIGGILIYKYGYTYAKYASNSVWDYFLRSKGFYFYSDYLDLEGIQNSNSLWDGSSVHFNIRNNLNDEVISNYDINYNIICTIEGEASEHSECHLNGTSSNEQSGVLSNYEVCVNNTEDEIEVSAFNKTDCELGGYDWTVQPAIKDLFFDIILTDETYEISDVVVNIKVNSTSPYQKELNGIFNLHKINNEEMQIKALYENYLNYDNLVITNPYSINKCIKLKWDSSKLLVDSDYNDFISYQSDLNGYINEVGINIESKESISLIFYSVNKGMTYNISEFTIEEIDC